MKKLFSYPILVICAIVLCSSCKDEKHAKPIDRLALVSRHNVVLNAVDTLGSLSVGNGEFAFTVDASGLQTFPEEYQNGISLGTQSQWAWHSIPDKNNFSVKDVVREFESCDGTRAPYAVQHSEGRAGLATNVLRANPHRLHLGLIGLVLKKKNGEEVKLSELTSINQQLDLWTGKIESRYQVEGVPVSIVVYSHYESDQISAKIESPMITEGRLQVKLSFPYGKDCHTCPGYDWNSADKHSSKLTSSTPGKGLIERVLDTTKYYVHSNWNEGTISESKPHEFLIQPAKKDVFEFSVAFGKKSGVTSDTFDKIAESSQQGWKTFWSNGGAIDFSECADPRAKELERRVILSQYLTRIQCAGSLPPQETGLTMNSWFGKYHLEMHWWHGAHFALWDRVELMERAMPWYASVTEQAKATAKMQGYEGARWQKMTDPFGKESPSNIGAFIIWQQPHPIYLAELLYRDKPDASTLEKYKDLVFNTADFMASFVKKRDGKYQLCHPLIPAQEIFRATETNNPAWELQYWHYGLAVSQEWRKRLGMQENEKWKEILDQLEPLSVKEGMYLPNSTTPEAYTDNQFRRDHPAVLGALGSLPAGTRVDTTVMANTLKEILNKWQWETTWGWDYPLVAMTAARLNKPDIAIDALLMDVQKNTYLVNGHNYQDKRLRLYLPGNGGVLAAISMMAAGWDGNTIQNPGFPKNGQWNVRWEGLKKMP
jgi:protein-glucosylgalactosylhydroxylysine glucosidase